MNPNFQRLFDQGVAGLAAQGFRKSVDPIGRCLMRSENGDRCFVGQFIPPERYVPEVEDDRLINVLCDFCDFVAVSTETLDFFSNCQRAHDDSHSPEDMRVRLRDVAVAWNLVVPEVLL